MKRFLIILMVLCIVIGMSSVGTWAGETEVWQPKMMMPISPGNFGTCVIGDNIFVLSGNRSQLVTIYNTKTDTWRMTPSMPEASDSNIAVATRNKAYV